MPRGYDKSDLQKGLVLSLPFEEGVGTQVRDVTRPHHPFTWTGTPTWVQQSSGIWAINFVKVAATDCLVCPAASCADLNFQQTGFSGMAWVKLPSVTSGACGVMGRGNASDIGWGMIISSSNLQFRGGYATPSNGTSTNDGRVTYDIWHLVGFSLYSGASAVSPLFVDGTNGNAYSVWSTHSVGDLAASSFDVGRFLFNSYFWFNGAIVMPRLWSRVLQPSEHMEIFNRERDLFGV